MRVLVVDDERCVAESIMDLLVDAGHDVRVTGNGREALDAMAASRPDVVLTDLMMPGMDGTELLRRMRVHPELRDLPVVVMSAVPHPARAEWPTHATWLRKPFSIDALLRELELVDGRRAR